MGSGWKSGINVFICYRRDDSRDFAGRVRDYLDRCCPGVRAVFLDTSETPPGELWRTRIDAALDRADLVLVLIGAEWEGLRSDGTRRIDEPGCEVRSELARALSKGRLVLPLLLNGRQMPAPCSLPPDIVRICDAQAYAVGSESFDRDMAFLAERVLGGTATRQTAGRSEFPPYARRLLRVGVTGAVLLLVALLHKVATGRGLSDSVGGSGAVSLLLIGVVLAAFLLPLRTRG